MIDGKFTERPLRQTGGERVHKSRLLGKMALKELHIVIQGHFPAQPHEANARKSPAIRKRFAQTPEKGRAAMQLEDPVPPNPIPQFQQRLRPCEHFHPCGDAVAAENGGMNPGNGNSGTIGIREVVL